MGVDAWGCYLTLQSSPVMLLYILVNVNYVLQTASMCVAIKKYVNYGINFLKSSLHTLMSSVLCLSLVAVGH